MKKVKFLSALVFSIVFLISILLPVAAMGASGVSAEKERVIVSFGSQPGAGEKALIRGLGGEIRYTYTLVPAMAVSLPTAALKGLANNPNVTAIEADVQLHASDYATELQDSWGVDRIDAEMVHPTNTGAGVKVAVLDSGIDYTHPELVHAYVGGYDFVNNDADPYDDNGHGTHVAGTIAALADGSGVIGVAPDVSLYALKVLDSSGSGYTSDIIAAIQWCAANGIQVTNNSYGGSSDPGETFKAAFDTAYAAGVLHISSAGNTGNPPGKGDSVGYPARYASVVAVAATDSRDKRATFSSTGPDVEIAAPGVAITSTVPGGTYESWSGTSMASPHVAGTAALIIAAGDATNPVAIRTVLQTTATDLGLAGLDPLYGYGLVDAEMAAGASPEPVDQAPVVAIDSPADGTSVDSGASVSFTGSATDVEDGDLSASIQWTSNMDGFLGSGASVAAVLSDGTHTITASVTDSGNQTTTASIDVTVGTVVPNEDVPMTLTEITSKSAGQNLFVTLSLADDSGLPVAGASIRFDLVNAAASFSASYSGASDSAGVFTVLAKKAPGGTYVVENLTITKDGCVWDGTIPDYSIIH